MKKGLSLFVASSMVVSMFAGAAYAADEKQSAGEYLNELGVIQGNGTDLKEDQSWKRQDVVVLLSRLLGEEEAAEDAEKTHEFEDVTNSFYDGFISWAVEEGLVEGKGNGKFGFNAELKNQEFFAIVLRAFGHDTTGEAYADVPELAVEYGFATEDTDFDAVPTRGETYETIVTALETEVPNTGKTLGELLGLVESTELAVSGVEALNLKEVKITFSKAVDKTEAEKEENYKVYNGGATTDLVNGGTATLQADGKTVIISLGTALNNGTSAKVEVKNLVTYTNDAVAVSDTTIPTVVGIQVTGPKTFTVEYSEPVTNLNNAEFTVDEGNYIVTGVAANGTNKVDVTVGVNFTNGEHKVKFNGSNVSDYAGYRVVPKTQAFTVAADTTAPTVAVKSVSPTQVKLVFSKPVTGVNSANVKYRHTFNNDTYSYTGDAAGIVTPVSSTEYTIDFTAKPIGLGSNNLYVSYVSDSGTKIEDLWGNDLAAVTLPLSVELDTVKPTVSEVKFVDAQTLKVTFSETVDLTTAQTLANYTVKDAAGSKVAVTSAVRGGTDNKEVTLGFAANALGGGSYTIAIEKVKDAAFVANTMDAYSSTLAVNDTVKPTAQNSKVAISGTEARVYIPFSEKMDPATLTKGNFIVTINGVTDVTRALGNDDSIVIGADGKSVELKIKHADAIASIDNVRVGAVRDVAGNGFASFTQDLTGASLAVDAVQVDTVEAISNTKIKVTFDGRLSTISAAGYSLVRSDAAPSPIALSVVSHTINSDNKSVVEFSLGTALTADAKEDLTPTDLGLSLVVGAGATGTKSYLGTQVTAETVAFADKIAPGVASVKVISDTTIEVAFNEALSAATFAATANGFSVAGGDAKLTSVAQKAGAGNENVVVITGTNFVANGTTVSYNDAAGLTDASSNKVASFTDKTATN